MKKNTKSAVSSLKLAPLGQGMTLDQVVDQVAAVHGVAEQARVGGSVAPRLAAYKVPEAAFRCIGLDGWPLDM